MPSQQSEIGGALSALARLIAERAAKPREHPTKICFFIGAGADISSHGLLFSQLKREAIATFLHRPLFDVTTPERVDETFDELFRELAPDDRARLVEWTFRRIRDLEPSDAYKLLVLLAEAGGVDAVVTTNFDTMLEAAQHELGRDVFQVFAPGFARPYPLGYETYDLPRKPYLKLHGDLASHAVIQLTAEEIQSGTYDPSMIELLLSIIRTHDLVVTGYSGYDVALARVIGDTLASQSTSIYWCNPRPPAASAPLYAAIRNRAHFVSVNFDELLAQVARPVLERPALLRTRPTYVQCLFDWRLDYCNGEYRQAYGERGGREVTKLFVNRPFIEGRLSEFLLQDRPLAMITGPS